ncbi:hypothetical protein [Chryseobacterium indoltheticum]|uniref:Uncharacterized protein n=1 Tax=Chryseobacterium indoltheticum TaxID=254 RepID=A0A381FAE6_9FLAO|nr:hypothetical protein [Chryseobacterium indoltheticum]AZA73576.1 hypothetical protein EG358_07320 [Chryseobacterium indoltheticum]SIR23894.1 hypothetical protein SAMN05421682_11577 [Chryseobacterium indoltheticum]SUX43541.1 Uncharacterised protein [Chryseobacterium indoltheticum]
MCNCSKPITQSECQKLREFVNDPEKRFFIYHIFDDKRGLSVAYVPAGENPNKIALDRKFINEKGVIEWFHVSEHPCLNE